MSFDTGLIIKLSETMKIMGYLKDDGHRKGSWKLGGQEAEVGSKVIERKGANMITEHLK